MGRSVTETLAGTCSCQKYMYGQRTEQDAEYQTCKIPLQDTFGIFSPELALGLLWSLGNHGLLVDSSSSVLDGVQDAQKKIAYFFLA